MAIIFSDIQKDLNWGLIGSAGWQSSQWMQAIRVFPHFLRANYLRSVGHFSFIY